MDNTKVLSTITQVLEVNTVKYTSSNIISITKDKSINDIKIPFTQQSFISLQACGLAFFAWAFFSGP